LHVSNYDEVQYFLGTLDADEPAFAVETRGRLDYGDFYAPQSLRDDDGRYLTWGWLYEARPERAQWDAGWSGMLSLPRHLSLSADGQLQQRPVPELETLRAERLASYDGTLAPTDPDPLSVRGDALELRAEVRLDGADEFGLVVRASPTGRERTAVRLTDEELVVDRSASSFDPGAAADDQRMPLPETSGPVEVRAFVDRSVVEVFVDERRCLTGRIYPTRPDSERVSAYASGGEATVESLDVWRLASIR